MVNSSDTTTTTKRFSWPWLRDRLFPRGTNMIVWASYVIIISMLVFYVLDPSVVRSEQPFFTTIMALAVLLVLNIVWDDLRAMFSQEEVGTSVLLLISLGLTLLATWNGRLFASIYLVFMLVAQTHAMLPLMRGMLLTVVITGSWLALISQMGISSEGMASMWIGLLIGLTFTISLSQVLRRYSEQTVRANQLLRQLQVVNAELVAARQREKELAVAEERVRVARDLHDGLGHHLTALSIQLQAVEKLSTANPQLAAEAARNARGEVQAALKEVRQSVAVLRQAPLDLNNLAEAIAALVEESARRSGLRASFEEEGPALALSPAAAITLYRTAQEGLTNIQKHAQQASQVRVRLTRQAQAVSLCVQDDGQNAPDCPPSDLTAGSYGLAGLRERAALLGGQLTCGARATGGFEVTITLPVQPA